MKMQFIIVFCWLALFSCEKELVVEPDPPKKLVQWKLDINLSDYQEELPLNPVMYGNWVITGYGSDYDNRNIPTVIAYNRLTGEKAWEFRHPEWPANLARNMVAKDHYLIIKFRDGLVCLDIRDQKILWQNTIPENKSFRFPMEIYDSYVYLIEEYYDRIQTFPFNDSISLVRYYIPDGKTEKIFGERIKDEFNHPNLHPPVIFKSNGRELAIFTRQFLNATANPPVDKFAVDVETKKIIWRDSAYSPLRSAWNTPPYVFGNNVISASDWSIYSWEASTGIINWRRELPSLNKQAGFSFSGPFINDDKIYAVENDGHVFCLSAQTGQILWQITNTPTSTTSGPARGPCNRPIVVDDILFINTWSDQALVLIDTKTGTVLERFRDANYNGRNVLYDEETKTFYVTADEKLRAFTINR